MQSRANHCNLLQRERERETESSQYIALFYFRLKLGMCCDGGDNHGCIITSAVAVA